MFVAPFDENDIFAFLMDHVRDSVFLVTLMFNYDFITGDVRTVNADVQNVVTCASAVHGKAILPTYKRVFQTFTLSFDL